MNFIHMLRLMTCALVFGLMTENFAVAADGALDAGLVVRGAIEGALDDQQVKEAALEPQDHDSEDRESADGDEEEGDANEALDVHVKASRIPSAAAIRAAGALWVGRGMNCARRPIDYIRNIDYREKANLARQNWHKIYDNGFVKTCWSGMCGGIRQARWYSFLMPASVRDYENVFVFGRDGLGENPVTLTTTDGYNFIVPAQVVGNGFMNPVIVENFPGVIRHLSNKFGVNVSSSILYLLCSIKKMQQVSDLSADGLFEANKNALGKIALRFYDVEFFHAIKACAHLSITNPVALEVLNHCVANALCERYPLSKVLKMVKSRLEFFPVSRALLMAALNTIVGKTLAAEPNNIVQAALPAAHPVAPSALGVPSGEPVQEPRRSKRVVRKR